jgi:hypothetical protein
MRRWLRLALCALAPLAGCGPVSAPGEATSTDQSAIQDGAVDTTHTFAVGIAQLSKLQVGQIAFCSGVLLAPNLVATARHCVANLASPEIFCATSNFGSVVPANDVLVTTDTTISPNGNLLGVSSIIVPSGPNQTGVCGNDIALLILDGSIKLPQYVTPVFNPPMTDSSAYSTNVTAIGYGVSSPVDEAGSTAGERRIKENIKLSCISNDPNFVDCLQSANASQVLSAGEFVSGDASTCDGDSGSGAYDQASFDRHLHRTHLRAFRRLGLASGERGQAGGFAGPLHRSRLGHGGILRARLGRCGSGRRRSLRQRGSRDGLSRRRLLGVAERSRSSRGARCLRRRAPRAHRLSSKKAPRVGSSHLRADGGHVLPECGRAVVPGDELDPAVVRNDDRHRPVLVRA